MSKVSVFIGMLLGCTVIGGSVSAQTFTAYDLAAPVVGQEQYGATLGLEFNVNTPIVINALGSVDTAAPVTGVAHTLNGTIITTIYDSSTQLPVPGLTASFSSASPGTLSGGYLFKPVGGLNGISLGLGSYVVAWTTVNNNDPDANSNFANFTPPTYNEAGNLISINKTRYRYNEQLPQFKGLDKYPLNTFTGQLDAGTFRYSPSTPEPSALSIFGCLIVTGSALLRRRRLRK